MSSLTHRSAAKQAPVQASFKGTYFLRATEKDPVIDAVHSLVDEAGLNLNLLGTKANVSRGTIYNWFDGPTRCPQHAKLAATLKALGYQFQIVPTSHRVNGHTINATAPRIIRRKKP